MFQPQATQTTEQVRRRRGMRPLTFLALGPIALGLVLGGCTAIEDTTDYIGDLFSHVEDDDEIFGEGAVPGGEEPYRSLSEVPSEAPAKSSAEERAALTAGLVADREKAQHTSEALRARVDPEEAMAQVRAVYVPADETVEPAPSNGG